MPVDAQAHHLVEEAVQVLRRVALEDGGVGGHPEAAPLRLLDGRDRRVVHPLAVDAVRRGAREAVQVDAER